MRSPLPVASLALPRYLSVITLPSQLFTDRAPGQDSKDATSGKCNYQLTDQRFTRFSYLVVQSCWCKKMVNLSGFLLNTSHTTMTDPFTAPVLYLHHLYHLPLLPSPAYFGVLK